MTSFLLIISFLLHIITLSTIFFMFKQGSLYKGEKAEETNTKEIMALLEEYIEEVKEENRRLQKELSVNTSSNETELQETPLENNQQNVNTENLPEIDKVKDEGQVSLQAQILQLHANGLSEEEIARKLNCGKTEVELMIKLHRK